jgi:hypothetical protein
LSRLADRFHNALLENRRLLSFRPTGTEMQTARQVNFDDDLLIDLAFITRGEGRPIMKQHSLRILRLPWSWRWP